MKTELLWARGEAFEHLWMAVQLALFTAKAGQVGRRS